MLLQKLHTLWLGRTILGWSSVVSFFDGPVVEVSEHILKKYRSTYFAWKLAN